MMIAACEPQEYVPFGRQQLVSHPKVIPTKDSHHRIESTLLNKFSQVAINDSSHVKEHWMLRSTENDGVECEEELYFKEKTVVWSIGPASVDNRSNRVLKCCYTSETPVQEALWCNFHLSAPDFPATFFTAVPVTSPKNASTTATDAKHLKNCVCILNTSALKFFTTTGQEFVTTLQFQVQKMWPVKYGLLLERRVSKETVEPGGVKRPTAGDLRRQSIEQSFLQKASFMGVPTVMDTISEDSHSNDLPTLFSLSHPLDEICPITVRNEALPYVANPDLKIVFTSESPSLCLTQDRKTGVLAVYLIRKALPQESELCWQRETRQSRRNSFNSVGKLATGGNSSFNVDMENRTMPAFLSARTRKSLGLGATMGNQQSSPFAPFEGRTSSPLASREYLSISPVFSHYSLSPQRKGDSLLQSPYTGTPSRIENRMMSEDVEYAEAKPLFPQICLQCVWVEPTDYRGLRENKGEAWRVFISTDLLGAKYLCYLVNLKLNLLKLDARGDEDFSVCADPVVLHAKDAAPLESRNMLAVIGLDGGVELFSGNVHVAKILISGVSSSVVTSSYLSDFTAGHTFFSRPSPGAFPKRSSLLPQPQPADSPMFNDSLGQFSPVSTVSSLSPTLPTTREGSLVALKDNVAGIISLEYTSAQLFRVELPHFGNSPLVDSVLTTLREILPSDVALQFLIKWYCTRNAPGCYNVCLREEFQMFSNLLYCSFGYDLEALRGTNLDSSSPVTRPKKPRTSELQSDEDWAALIGSHHHSAFSRRLPSPHLEALHLQPEDIPLSPEMSDTPLAAPRVASKGAAAGTTPMVPERSKRQGGTGKKGSADDTPMPPKTSLGKGRLPGRFQKSLNKGETTSPFEAYSSTTKTTSLIRNKKSLLHPYMATILFALHLLYEDLKLSTLRIEEMKQLVPILYQLAKDLGCDRFVHHYWLDFPRLCRLVAVSAPAHNILPPLLLPPPSIFRHLNDILMKNQNLRPYPYLRQVNEVSKTMVQVFGLMSCESERQDVIFQNVLTPVREDVDDIEAQPETEPSNPIHRIVLHLTKKGITAESLETFPAGVAFVIHCARYRCRDDPGSDWSKEAYRLAERHDLASLCRNLREKDGGPTNKISVPKKSNSAQLESETNEDGMEELRDMDTMKLRWATDQRAIELRRMLQSAMPVRINVQQRPDVSDHEFIQEQERYLYALSARTMALPVGRGMATLGCATPVITEKMPVPPLCLNGRVPPSDKVLDMSHIEVPTNLNVWPLFHNGVAAGLRISPNAPDIDSQWIIYNKPKVNNDEQIEHSGFLMALGLNGHLMDLVDLAIFMYLVKSHEMTRVGLLLGVAVSKRGTMDVHTVKMVSVHIEAMLPPTGIELDIDVIVEPAALMSLGFLYQGTANRHIAQVLLQEIGRPPGPEMESSVDRESYSLAAGLALGLVVFGLGNSLSGLADMTIPDTLHHFMVGGPKRPYLGSQRDKYKTPSFLIFEGNLVNTHVTGPGATLALGMLYFNTGNKAVAEWLKVPETQHLLEEVLPDALLLRTLAKSLILWSDIEPSHDWVMSHVPAFVLPFCLVKPQANGDGIEIDYETMNQAYCNIVAGGCMAIGLRFAGSANEEAFETLSFFARKFTTLLGKSIAELCGRATIETCLNVITVSLGMVMAGTGNLDVMRLCRYLRSRVGPNNSVVTYGSHLATHMALGLLFLGGGTLTLSTSPDAIAALLCAFYPKWPICSSDNRYHLQALRHLYVLAVEPRLIQPRDIETRTLCYAHVTYVYLESSRYGGKVVRQMAPCLLPELNLLKEVRIDDDRYWSISFSGKNWEDFKKILMKNSYVDVKKRAGFLSYIDDPHGFRSLLARTLTSDDTIPWGVRPMSMNMFSTSNPMLENFLHFFFDMKQLDQAGEVERKTLAAVTDITYFCVTKDKLSLLPYWLSLIKIIQNLSTQATASGMWQWKLVFSQAVSSSHLIPTDVALSVKQDILVLLSSWEPGVLIQVKDYFLGNYDNQGLDEGRIAAYLTFHDLPYRGDVNFADISSGRHSSVLHKLCSSGASPTAIMSILSLLEI